MAVAPETRLTVGEFVTLVLQVGLAAVFSFGGIATVLVELQHDFVNRLGLLSSARFTQTYALSCAAPGPNGVIFMAVLGLQAGGIPGAIACLIGWSVPTLLAMHWLGRLGDAAARPGVALLLAVLSAGAVGLVFAGALALVKSFDFATPRAGVTQTVMALAAIVALQRGWLRPLPVLGICIAAGAILL